MPIMRVKAEINVLEAARARVRNVFSNGLPVFLAFSGGKDSLCLADIVVDLIQRGEIDPKQLTVHFIDEEAIFPCIEKTALAWRRKFLLLGAQFDWYCIEVRHYNCFNQLENDESFICWDSQKQEVWVRRPPKFAIRSHPLLNPRKDTYQFFLEKALQGGITITGVRTAESLQRLRNLAARMSNNKTTTKDLKVLPIHDWSDKDVWLYLLQRNIDIPEIYLYMWQAGFNRRQMRVSQFFSSDTARSLVKMNEYYPDLMERVIQREPNAYLASLYWDSEMFGRSTASRKKLEQGQKDKDYRAELIRLFSDMDHNFPTKHKRHVADRYRNFFLQASSVMTSKHYKNLYEGLIKGDPKLRTLRGIYYGVYGGYIEAAKKERGRTRG